MKLQEHPRWKKDLFTDASGTVWRIHKRVTCEGSHCAVHNPSDHPLMDAPIMLRWPDPFSLKPVGFVERVCDHGYGHSDPDSVAFFDSVGVRSTDVHGCDGCCVEGLYEKLNGDKMNTAFDAEDWQPEDGVASDPLDMSELSEHEIDVEVKRFAERLAAMPCAKES